MNYIVSGFSVYEEAGTVTGEPGLVHGEGRCLGRLGISGGIEWFDEEGRVIVWTEVQTTNDQLMQVVGE